MAFFRRNRNKKSITVLILLIVVVVGAYFLLHAGGVKAEWYDANWYYREAVNITNAGTAQTDYQVSITLDTATLYTAGKIQVDCDDIRITDTNGKLLPYWIETGTNACNTATTAIWTKVPSLPTSGQTVYVYYGNPNATNIENGNNVFELFENFTTLPANWAAESSPTTNWAVSSGALRSTTVSSDYSSFTKNGSNFSDFIIDVRWKYSGTTHGGINFRGQTVAADSGYQWIFRPPTNVSRIQKRNPTQTYVVDEQALGMTLIADTWYNLKLKAVGTQITGYVNGTQVLSGDMGDTEFTSGKVGIQHYDGTNDFDDFRVRKTASTEPTIGSTGSEEKGPAPVAYWKFDEGQGDTAYDDSSNNNDGTLGGGTADYKPTWQTGDMCVSGKCLKFDGTDDYISGTDSKFPSGSGARSIEMWINPMTVSKNYQEFFFYGTAASGQGILFSTGGASEGTNKLLLGRHSGNSGASTKTLSINTWQHIAFTLDDSGNVNFYINGVNAGTTTISGVNTVLSSFTVGKGWNSSYFQGFMDDVRVYPYVRTVAQIKADYNSRGSVSGTSVKVGNESAYLSNGLVGYWKMDEASGAGSTLADSSGAGNTGTAVLWGGGNTATDSAHVAGKYGNAFSFDGGDDYLDVPDATSLDITKEITISVWTYLSSAPVNNYTGIISKYYAYSLVIYPNRIVQIALPSATSWKTIGTLPLSEWTLVTISYNGNKLRTYMNGSLTNEYDVTGSIDANNSTLEIGNYVNSVRWTFPGLIDEARIYNRALSPKEISDLYNFAPGPVGHWKMDDKVSGNSQTLVDSSTYANNGTTYYGANATGMNCRIIGKYGSGCLLDGIDDYVSATPQSTLNSMGPITVEAWYKANISSAGITMAIVSKDGGAGQRNWDLAMQSGTLYWSTVGATDSDQLNAGITEPTFGQWYHVVGTWDGVNATGHRKIYVNGVLQALTVDNKANNGANSWSTSPNIRFGVDYQGAGRTLNGMIDDVRIYNYARTQKQILEDMNAGHSSVGSPIGSYAGYWKFDEGYGTSAKDQSVNANHGTITGATWNNNGKFGKAISFDENGDYVDLGSNNALTNNINDITISAWVKLGKSLGSASDNYEVISNESYQNYGYLFRVEDTTSSATCGKIHLRFSQAGANTAITTPSNYFPNDQSWHHLVGVKSGTTGKIYLDGKEIYSGGTLSSPVNSSASTRIGGNSQLWNGLLDEVKIYPFALTADDIKTEYNRGSALVMGSLSDTSNVTGGSIASNSASAEFCIPGDSSVCSAPVGQWKVDEHAGNSSYDTSGNNNNGSLGGGTVGYMPTWKSSSMCHSGSCLNFDGTDDYMDLDYNVGADLNGASGITFEAWIKNSDLPPASGFRFMFGTRIDGGGAGFEMGLYDSNKIRIAGRSVITDAYQSDDTVSFTTTNQWRHIVGILDFPNDKIKVYLDGVEVLNVAKTFDNNTYTRGTPTQEDRIGNNPSMDSTYYFNGFIDDIRIFNYVRTPAQIAWDYNRGKPVGWWKFDECQGTSAYDASGNGNTGTITIGATVPQSTAGTCTTPVDGTGAWYNGVSGKFNSAMSFDGVDDSTQVTNTSLWNFGTNDFSIDFWFKTSSNSRMHALNFGSSNSSNNISFDFNDGSYGVWVYWMSNGSPYIRTTNTYRDNNWHHLVFLRSGTSAKLYIDGNYINGLTNSTSISITGNLYIGGVSGLYWNGSIDDVKIYNYALTPQQIKLDYNQGAAVRFGPNAGRP